MNESNTTKHQIANIMQHLVRKPCQYKRRLHLGMKGDGRNKIDMLEAAEALAS